MMGDKENLFDGYCMILEALIDCNTPIEKDEVLYERVQSEMSKEEFLGMLWTLVNEGYVHSKFFRRIGERFPNFREIRISTNGLELLESKRADEKKGE